MEQRLVKLLNEIKCDTNSDLCENVWCAIVARNKRIARIKFIAFTSVGFSSIATLVPTFKILSNDLTQSGFFDYFSLLSGGFPYNKSLFSYWKELGFSLLESLPTMSILLLLALIFIFFLSMQNAIKQIIKSQMPLSL